ncbi:hypothetical protein GCM10011494_12150 [Novosphingobium endophyticum]|uniref:Sulfotransferase family protein n=1 Tax=Novosphingobium endophyticum TaxID=1955250 RepID=A0A916TQJ9_9SPHN|nr:sulfotransferase [Novosphingobium endophyticum]GGB95266.1 hypothetical protein GCM10011494_12150 [Novosphingobium endophyticum]
MIRQIATAAAKRCLPRDARLRIANRITHARGAGEKPMPGLEWLFVANLPNSGSTALAMLLSTARGATTLTDNGEAQWLMPELSRGIGRWDKTRRIDYAMLRAVWIDAARRRGIGANALVVEKSPPNIVRLRAITEAFSDMPVHVIVLTRDPYAVCASWAKRYPPARLGREWDPRFTHMKADSEALFEALGALYGERANTLESCRDMAQIVISYEELTESTQSAAARLTNAIPRLDAMNAKAQVRVKDYAPQELTNMNAAQIERLSSAQRRAITRGLLPYRDVIEAQGYSLDQPEAG